MPIDIRVNLTRHDGLGRPFGVDGVRKFMDQFGIETAVLVPRLAVDTDFKRGNEELLDVIESDDRLFGYLVVNPNYSEESVRLVRSVMNSQKLLAIGCFRGATRPHPNLDDYREILKAYRRFGKPIFVQTVHAEAVAAAEEIAREFSTMKFVFGSMGGAYWKRSMGCSRLLNISVETSGSFDAEKIEEAVEHLGPHRVLYGSDLPFSDPAPMLALIRSSNIPEDAMEKILGQNAQKLFKLGRHAPAESKEV